MSNEASFHARITADAKQFVAEMQGAAAALATLVKQAESAGKVSTAGAKDNGTKAAREIQDVYGTARKEADKLHQQTMQDISAENSSRSKGMSAAPALGGSRWNAKAIPALPEGTNLAALAGVRMNLDQRMIDSKKSLAKQDAEFNRIGITMLRQRDAEEAKSTRERIAMNRMHSAAIREDATRQAKAQQRQMDAMVTGRYALYDQAAGYELIARKAAMLTAAMASTVLVAAQFETAFTSVERAMQPLPDELDGIRNSLLKMTTELPIAFGDMSKIATLGAQMGVTASGIESFTKNVASFSAITGATIDETAQRFGRIAALANIDSSDFNKLGSAVAYTGINAVATEQEILALSESIAAATTNAGFAADETIALATTLASLGIAPEQARGVVLRVFADITRAVDTGGKKLENFGKIAGMSIEETSKLWKTDPQQYFNKLLSGLGTVDNFTKAMDSLGFTETRETNVLQRLSQNMNIYNKSLSDSQKSYEEGTFLADAYAKTADNLDAKFAMFLQTIQQLGDAIGSGLIGPAGQLVDSLKEASLAASEFFKSPIGKFVTPAVAGITALITAFSVFRAVQIKTIAQIFAMRTAMIQLGRTQETTKGAFNTAALSLLNLQRAVTMANGQVKFLTRSEYELALSQMKVAGSVRMTDGSVQALTRSEYDLALAEGRVAAGSAASADAINGWSKQGKAAAITSRALTVAMGAIGWIGMAAGVVSAIGLFSEMNKVTMDLANSGGGLASFRDAMYEDTKAVAAGAEYFGKYQSKVTETSNVAKGYVSTLQEVTGGQTSLNGKLTDVNEKITEQTIYLGENSQAWLANALANDEAVMAMFKQMEESGLGAAQMLKDLNIDFQGLEKAALAKPGSGAFDYIMKVSPEVSKTIGQLIKGADAVSGGTKEGLRQAMEVISKTGNSAQATAAKIYLLATSVDALTKEGVDNSKIMELVGVLFPKAADGADTLTTSLEATAKAVRTVVDYASDLSSVFSRVVEIKFGRQQALDEIATGWNNIAEKAADAAKAMEDANNTKKEAEANKAILEYQLSVAQRYGDEKRATAIRAKLGKVNETIADQNEKLTKTQEDTNKSTTDGSKASIQNKAALLGMVGSYQTLIEMYAKTGLKGKALTDKIAELSGEFKQSGIEAGFAEKDIQPYVDLFSEFKVVVDKTPRDVTVEFNAKISAALQAVNEFVAKLNGLDGRKTKTTITTDNVTNFIVSGSPGKRAIGTQINAIEAQIEGYRLLVNDKTQSVSARIHYSDRIGQLNSTLETLKRELKTFAGGGIVTGAGGPTSDSIMARLSNGEFVMRAAAVNAYGVDFMNAINQQQAPRSMPSSLSAAAKSGSNSQVVYLSPDDRALLRAAIDRPVNLYTDNQKIAASANAGNIVLAQRGSN